MIPRSAVAWMDRAACLGADLSLFFPEPGVTAKEALQVCDGCPVQAQCLSAAIAYESGGVDGLCHYAAGVWGGTTQTERRRLTNTRACPGCGCDLPRGSQGRCAPCAKKARAAANWRYDRTRRMPMGSRKAS